MKPSSSIILIFALMAVVCGCHRGHDTRLGQLDSALWRNPDSVYKVLQGIDTTTLEEPDRALWVLLRAESADKSYQTDTTSKMIEALSEYYFEGNHEPELHPRVNYILGRIHIERGEKPKALEFFRRTLRSSDDKTDTRLMVAVYGQLVTICSQRKLFSHALSYSKKMAEHVRKLNDPLLEARSALMLAYQYQGLNYMDSARRIYEKYGPVFSENLDSAQRSIYVTQLAACYKECGDYERADSVIKSDGIAVDESSWSSVESIINDIDLHFGRTEGVERRSLDLLANSDDIYARKTAARNLARIYLDKGDGQRAFKYAEIYSLIADSISEMEAAAIVAELDEFYSQSELAERNLEMERSIASLTRGQYIGIAGGVILLVGCLLFFRHRAIRRKRDYKEKEDALVKERDRYLAELNEINDELLKTKDDLDRANSDVKERNKLLEKNNKEVDKLRKRVRVAESRIKDLAMEKEKKTRMLNAINAGLNEREFIRKFYSENKAGATEKAFLELSQFVETLDSVFYKSVSELGLSTRDFFDAMMIRLNLGRNKTARIFKITGGGVTNRRKRLYEKFSGEGCDMRGGRDWQEFIMSFSTVVVSGS